MQHHAHVCFVSDELYPGTAGGIGRLLYDNARELRAVGWAVTFLLLTDQRETDRIRRHLDQHVPGCRVLRVDEILTGLDQDEDIPLGGFHFLPYYQSYRVALALKRIVAHDSIDLVEFADYRGLAYVTLKWRRLLGAPFEDLRCWVRLHGTYELWLKADGALSHSRQELHTFLMERYCLKYADGWLSPSESVAVWYHEVYGLGNTKPLVVAPPRFQQLGPGKAHPRCRMRPLEILFYGKLQHVKGADIFVGAALLTASVLDEPVTFHLVGQDVRADLGKPSYGQILRRMIPAQSRHMFKFHGRVHPKQLSKLAQRCSLAVVPSRAETFCLAAHELNWIGIPLILRDLPAFADFFHDGVDCRKFSGTDHDAQRMLGDLIVKIVQSDDLSSGWRWNAEDIIDRQTGAAAYATALGSTHRHTPGNQHDSNPAVAGAAQPRSALNSLVSIIVPYFNSQSTLAATLDSVRRSTYPHWECIIIDDGSTDLAGIRAFDQCREDNDADGRFRFLRQENGGLSSARNAGLRIAHGDFVLPLNSDDVIEPTYIELGVKALINNPELAAISCFATYFQEDSPPKATVDYAIAYDLDPLLITLENRAGVAGSLFRKSALPVTGYAETLEAYEDWDLWWTLAQETKQVEVIPVVLYRYRRRKTGLFLSVGGPKHDRLMSLIEQRHPHLLATLGHARAKAQVRLRAESTPAAKLQRRLRDAYLRWRQRV